MLFSGFGSLLEHFLSGFGITFVGLVPNSLPESPGQRLLLLTSALSPVTCSVAGKFITDAMFSIIGLRTELGRVHAIQGLRLTVANYSVATD